MEQTTKTLITVVFPGLAGFVIGCMVVLPQLIMLGMSPTLTLFVGVVVTGLFSSFVAALLRLRMREEAQQDAELDAGDLAPAE